MDEQQNDSTKPVQPVSVLPQKEAGPIGMQEATPLQESGPEISANLPPDLINAGVTQARPDVVINPGVISQGKPAEQVIPPPPVLNSKSGRIEDSATWLQMFMTRLRERASFLKLKTQPAK